MESMSKTKHRSLMGSEEGRNESLLWWVMSELHTLLDVAFQSFICNLEEFLFLRIDIGERVDSLFSTVGLNEMSQSTNTL